MRVPQLGYTVNAESLRGQFKGGRIPLWSVQVPKKRASIVVPVTARSEQVEVPAEPRSFTRLYITERQLEILGWVREGKSARDIGDILGISPRTVEHQLEKVCDSLGVRTRFQAVLKVRDLGVLA